MPEPHRKSPPARGEASQPAPYPRTIGGLLVWVGIATALMGYISYSVYRSGKQFKVHARTTARAEARATLASLRAAEEAYRAEHGVYLATTTRGEDDFYPPPDSEPRRKRFQPRTHMRPAWVVLAPAVPKKRLFCGYVVVSGPAGSLAPAGPRGRALFGHRAPSRAWFYARARCIQGEGKVLLYETTSESPQIRARE